MIFCFVSTFLLLRWIIWPCRCYQQEYSLSVLIAHHFPSPFGLMVSNLNLVTANMYRPTCVAQVPLIVIIDSVHLFYPVMWFSWTFCYWISAKPHIKQVCYLLVLIIYYLSSPSLTLLECSVKENPRQVTTGFCFYLPSQCTLGLCKIPHKSGQLFAAAHYILPIFAFC